MNARQAAKAAAKRIEEMEHYNAKCKADITMYNRVVTGMIEGQSPCQWCEDHEECQRADKDGKGCSEWWLAFTNAEVEEAKADDSEGISLVGSEGGA